MAGELQVISAGRMLLRNYQVGGQETRRGYSGFATARSHMMILGEGAKNAESTQS
jgi:hypothetical protein